MNHGTLNKLIDSFEFAKQGIYYAFKTQNSFRIQILCAILSIILAIFFRFNRFEWMILIFTICAVLSAELLNTVIETIVDLYTNEFHQKAKLAKDLSAGVVLLTCMFAVAIGLILFIPHFITVFGLSA